MSIPPQSPSLRYKIFLLLASPFALIYTLYRALKDGGLRYLLQRFGLYCIPSSSQAILIHCASVGEVKAATPLILELSKNYPEMFFVISTNTPTGAQLVAKLQNEKISHMYIPLDYSLTVKAFLKCINPICVLIFETEIWPTLIFQVANKNLPIAIINGRLSPKTTNANNLVLKEYHRSIQNFTLVLTRSDNDRTSYINIGSHEKSTHTVGNIKYASRFITRTNLPCTIIKRPFFLAASTHDGEELQIVQHIEILKRKNFLLVIAPRYPDRSKQLSKNLKDRNLNIAIRSNKDEITDETDIYIVDTLGELDMFYNEAALVFVGGSLIERGGHNFLEPASFGKCIIVGPNTDNFSLETEELLKANGLIQVSDSHELGVKLIHMLNNDAERIQYGKNAQEFINAKKEVLQDYVKYIKPLIQSALH